MIVPPQGGSRDTCRGRRDDKVGDAGDGDMQGIHNSGASWRDGLLIDGDDATENADDLIRCAGDVDGNAGD